MTQFLLFDDDGHITDDGLRLLISGEADELSQLELSEHLDFCDRCVDRYCIALNDALPIEPPEGLVPKVMGRNRKRTQDTFFKQATKVGLAAGLTILVWFGGVFRGNALKTTDDFKRQVLDYKPTFGVAMQDFGQDVQQFFRQWNLFLKGEPTNEK